jgi:hypothetical protein
LREIGMDELFVKHFDVFIAAIIGGVCTYIVSISSKKENMICIYGKNCSIKEYKHMKK